MNYDTPKGRWTGFAAALVSASLALTLSACGTSAASTASADVESASAHAASAVKASEESASSDANAESSTTASAASSAESIASSASGATATVPTKDAIQVSETMQNAADGEHAIQVKGSTESYKNIAVEKTGEASGDEADFYGENSAIFATDGATLDLSNIVVSTDGTHANAVFSYGEGTTVNVSDSVIETSGNCSGGLMTTGGATMNASNLNIETQGNSSAAIRSDRGGGTVNVDGGSYVTHGTGSPVIYSTADVTVGNAQMESTASQGVVVEGKNSVTLDNVTLVADNNTKNSDKSDYYQAVMIYQSMSGDAAEGTASFAMNGGTLTNKKGDVFFVNNTVAEISLAGADIVNESDGVFLRAAAAGWGSEGSNGGQVTLNAEAQTIEGDMVVDDVSHLNLYLKDASVFEGAVNADGAAGDVYVELDADSTWTLTADSYITSLTCDADAIDLNGHTLYVDGKAYEAGTQSAGEAIAVTVSASGGHGGSKPPAKPGSEGGSGAAPSGEPPAKPDGAGPSGRSSGEPPAKPGSEGGSGAAPSGEPPAKPDGSSSSASADTAAGTESSTASN